MHIPCLICHFLEATLFWDVLACFWFFLLLINRRKVLYFYRQMRRDYKIKFTDKLKQNLCINLDLAKVHCLKELIPPYIVSYLHFLNLNILTLPKLSLSRKLCLIWHNSCLPCFLPTRFTHMHASLQNQNKCKLSIAEKINHRDLRPLYSASHRAINVLSMSRIEKELCSLFLRLFSPFSNKKD